MLLVDASGATRCCAQFDLRRRSAYASAAIFGPSEFERSEGESPATSASKVRAWLFWLIPIKDGRLAGRVVARVSETAPRTRCGVHAADDRDRPSRMRSACATRSVHTEPADGNYSLTTRMRGDRNIMVGDASLLRPVCQRCYDGDDAECSAEQWSAFAAIVQRGEVRVVRKKWPSRVRHFLVIWRFNSPGMRSLLLLRASPRVQEAVIDAGGRLRSRYRRRSRLGKVFYYMFSLHTSRSRGYCEAKP